jgi:hypothetical protein
MLAGKKTAYKNGCHELVFEILIAFGVKVGFVLGISFFNR